MSVTGHPHLFTLDANVGRCDPWLMVPSASGIRLAPLQSAEIEQFSLGIGWSLSLDLTDLGFLDATEHSLENRVIRCGSALDGNLVLLLTSSLGKPFAKVQQRCSALSLSGSAAQVTGSWLETSTHPVLSADGPPPDIGSLVEQHPWSSDDVLRFDGTCRYLLATPSGVGSRRPWVTPYRTLKPGRAHLPEIDSRFDGETTYQPSPLTPHLTKRLVASSRSARIAPDMVVYRGDRRVDEASHRASGAEH